MSKSPGGRPAKSVDNLRNHQINIRLNKSEKDKLVALQQETGLTYAELLLMTESEKVAKVRRLRRVPLELQRMITALLKMGSLLAYYKNKVDEGSVQSLGFTRIIEQLMCISDYIQKQSLLASGLPSLLTYFDYLALEIPKLSSFLISDMNADERSVLEHRLGVLADVSLVEHQRLCSYFNTELMLVELESFTLSDLHSSTLMEGLEHLLEVINKNHVALVKPIQ